MQDTAAGERATPSREAILAAATRLMSRHGYAATSISRISVACGLPASSIYWHFGSKEGIYLAVLRQARQALLAGLPPATVSGTGESQRLSRFLESVDELFQRHPHDLRLLVGISMLEESACTAAREELSQYRLALRRWLADSLGSVFTVPGTSPMAEELAGFLLSMAGGASIARWFQDPDASLPTTGLHVALTALARHHRAPN
ncbi:TetR/AcrR family transcriptional regulator [Couchioplanes azureus]|uniref:TetR/AcrR family transcriptional regulator n=1 Tax=Couchioplanes caeruleus TaxID=56438 RepID=UPI001670E286|nr:TetR/AcrR family transcriptional regulator [Couchioplanes caeruleus]GGQ81828.1 TetR family transcriptional regulator [Couchioplanes caeruleus subsp. azureus]